ncbi:hypothetical protein [Streptomyces sp. NPDC056401]|uniref:hypothetical protein n=1 Tax=Streptomyces sp. NPDC056401 TaxID=3345809 RepID=UPI0035D93B35
MAGAVAIFVVLGSSSAATLVLLLILGTTTLGQGMSALAACPAKPANPHERDVIRVSPECGFY